MTDKMDIQYIAVRNLSVIWVQSQRPYNEKWAKEIAEEFDPDKFDPLVVTKPNGHGIYHIIEGQHRRYALEMFAAKMNRSGDGSNEQAPCRVVAEADPARAAEIWLGINQGRKRTNKVHEFRVSVVANREPEKSINRIILRCGYKVAVEHRDNCVSAVSSLRRAYIRQGADVLATVLNTLRALWDSDPAAVQGHLICGFAIFLHEFGTKVSVSRLKKNIADKFTPWKFLGAANMRRDSTQERLEEAVAELLIREYNRNLKDSAKLRRKS
jgi:hypothetical protein